MQIARCLRLEAFSKRGGGIWSRVKQSENSRSKETAAFSLHKPGRLVPIPKTLKSVSTKLRNYGLSKMCWSENSFHFLRIRPAYMSQEFFEKNSPNISVPQTRLPVGPGPVVDAHQDVLHWVLHGRPVEGDVLPEVGGDEERDGHGGGEGEQHSGDQHGGADRELGITKEKYPCLAEKNQRFIKLA